MRGRWYEHQSSAAPTNATWYETLAYTIIFTLNTYGEDGSEKPFRIADGNDEVWLEMIRGWTPPAGTIWWHGSEQHQMVRCARVPYLVKSRHHQGNGPRRYTDHFLLGVATLNQPLASNMSWVNSGNNDYAPLKLFGHFITDELFPNPVMVRRVAGWNVQGPANEGYTKVPTPPGAGQSWKFRELSLVPDSSVRITFADTAGMRWYLLIGYEGGGAW